jgi:outer membrane protein assembly factor BamD
MHRLLVVVTALTLALGCATKKPIIPPDKLWTEANEAFGDEAYEIAVDRYKTLLDQHPFDPNAEEAELKIAQAYYLSRRYPEAIAAFGDFERMHPTSPHLALVEYHLGMAYLAQVSTADRDQQHTGEAYTYFRNLIDRFPNSEWAEKSRLRVRECRESLATHDADIAAYYLRHRNLRAAEARLRGLLSDYVDTDATARALYAFAREYTRREEGDGATLALATLLRNHPDGPLAADARAQLGDRGGEDGEDPRTLLIARIDRMSSEGERQKVPDTVSAYPSIGGGAGGGTRGY